jgi:hypothetical protein
MLSENATTGRTNGRAETTVVIRPPNFQQAEFRIRGTAPYMQHRFSQKAREMIRAKQAAGQQARSRRPREARDFDADYEAARYRMVDGRNGIPSPSFRNAMISACRTVGFKMTLAKLSIFTVADGLDAVDGTPLVAIEGEPERDERMARNETGVIDIRVRPLWREWAATVRFRWDADQFSAADVANLLARAGGQVGIGEGRPDSPNSAGIEFGTFEIVNDHE